MFEDVKNCGVGKFISNGMWKHPDRIINSYEIIFVTKGAVYINIAGTEYALHENEIVMLEPNIRHYGYKSSENTEFFWLHWQTELTPELNINHSKLENPYCVSLYFHQLLDARVMNKPSEMLDYLTRLILMELCLGAKQIKVNPVAEKIYAWVKANNNIPITDVQIADKFGYNVDYLNRVFKANFSKTLKRYINEERMKYIKTLMLDDNLSLKEVAIKAGFSEYKYFLKFFKYHEKITPTEFYKQFCKIHVNSR